MAVTHPLRRFLGMTTSKKRRQPSLRNRLLLERLEDRRVLAAGFFQGFEVDNSDWFAVDGDDAVRVASGTNGILSQAGGFHAEVGGGPTATPTTPDASAFTRWGGYTNSFPAGGYTTSIGIYLDLGTSAANDTRFDFSSAISRPDGAHRRDFIFNGGYYNDSDVTGSGDRFVISTSNNSVGWPKNPGRSPLSITDSGWYTFQHRFYDSGGGVLAVAMSVLDSGGAVLRTWTHSDPSDIIGSTVGGNRYGWFANNQFEFLAIDNSFQSTPDTVYVDDNWVGWAVGTDPDGAGDAKLIGFDAFGTIQDAVNAVAAGGAVKVLPGAYDESPSIAKSLALESTGGRDVTTINLQTGPAYLGALSISGVGNEVAFSGFTINGRDGTASSTAASNILVGVGLDSVTIADNRIRVGSIGPVSTGDDGFGIITTYSTSVDTGNLTISGNDFEPLNTSGGRAFFINPGVDAFVFSDNDITGEFTRTAITQAKNGLVKDNVITGTGSSAGLGTLGYPDPTLYGHTEFDCNEITQTVTAINIFATNDVMIRNNTLSNNGTGVRVQDFASLSFDPATIHINSNDISGNTGWGVRNTAAALPEVDAAFNWWGSSSGPSGEGPGTGDAVSVKVDFTPWLLDSVFSGANLIFTDAAGNALVVDQATGAFTFTGADGTFVSGSDAQIAADGTIKIHDQDESEPVNLGEKIDGSGNIETAISVVIKFKNGVKKSFALTLDSLLDVC